MNESDIFMTALDIDSTEARSAFLDEACGEDRPLRARVEALLASHAAAESFLECPAMGGRDTSEQEPITNLAGTIIGRYKLLEQVGEGGFGYVYVAEQTEPVRRRVALKVIKPGMDTRQVIARFEAERQALALMDHPNIAKILDAGTTGGEVGGQRSGVREENSASSLTSDLRPLTSSSRPYFVMELVQGVPITEYCDKCHLTIRERLKLFIQVCQAVQHAHQKGIIHRDIKPTNVLVGMQDGQPAPKIIDFGIAKALNQRLTEQTLATGYSQLIGTPLYMSPEQAELSPLGADTRSDIYSLGVLLYELLTGSTPFDKDRLHSASYDELRRILRDEDPPRPSTRLSTLDSELATTVAERHRTDIRRLTLQVRGDLDWIVMKCLEKDRTRRYETASSVARDIERYLHNEPVQACPPSRLYRLQKYVKRHKWAFASAGLVAMCLLVLAVGALVYAGQQRHLAMARTRLASDREQARQQAEAARVDAETSLYRALLGQAAAVRTARVPGYRRAVWDYLHSAAALDISQKNLDEIRDEVLACLGDPIGLDPIESPEVERMLRPSMPAYFRAIVHKQQQDAQRGFPSAISPDGRWLAMRVPTDDDITLWDAQGNVAAEVQVPLGHIGILAISPDGRALAAGCDRGTVIYSLPELSIHTFFRGCPVYLGLTIHPGGHYVATLDTTRTIEVWSLRSNRFIVALAAPPGVHTIEYSADGSLLLGMANDRATIVTAWPMTVSPEKRTLLGHRAAVPRVLFSPDGRQLATASHDDHVRIWDVETGALLHDFLAHQATVQALKFSPDGRWLCSGDRDTPGLAILWDVATGAQLATAQAPGPLWDFDFDSTERLLVAAGYGFVTCWQIEETPGKVTLELVRTVPLEQWVTNVVFRPGTTTAFLLNHLPMPDDYGNCVVWQYDVAADDAPKQLHIRAIVGWYSLNFDRSGERLFYRSKDHSSLGVWHVSLAEATYLRTPVPLSFHAFTADSRWMAAPDNDQLKLFDLEADRQVLTLPQRIHNNAGSLALSPDGSRLAVGGNDGDLAIWDLQEVANQLREFGFELEIGAEHTARVAATMSTDH